MATTELQEQWTCCKHESPGATIKEPVAGPRQGPGRKQAEGFSRWREGTGHRKESQGLVESLLATVLGQGPGCSGSSGSHQQVPERSLVSI